MIYAPKSSLLDNYKKKILYRTLKIIKAHGNIKLTTAFETKIIQTHLYRGVPLLVTANESVVKPCNQGTKVLTIRNYFFFKDKEVTKEILLF